MREQSYLICLLWIFVILLSEATVNAQSAAPTVSVAPDSEYFLDHPSNKISVTASDGDTDPPSGGCPPWAKEGDAEYLWGYTGIVGDITAQSPSSSSVLKLNRDVGTGRESISVMLKQKWCDEVGTIDYTYSPTASHKYVKIQVPTSITQISYNKTSNPGQEGGEAVLEVRDQDDDVVKGDVDGGPMVPKEWVPETTIVFYLWVGGNLMQVPPYDQQKFELVHAKRDAVNPCAAGVNVDNAGRFTDTPIASLNAFTTIDNLVQAHLSQFPNDTVAGGTLEDKAQWNHEYGVRYNGADEKLTGAYARKLFYKKKDGNESFKIK